MGDLSAQRQRARRRRRRRGPERRRSSPTLVDLIGEGVISGKIAKDVLALLLGAGQRRRSARARRSARPRAGERRRRDRSGGRRGDRSQSRQGRAGEDEARHARLVRRSGDEVDRRQSQSASVSDALKAQTRTALSCAERIGDSRAFRRFRRAAAHAKSRFFTTSSQKNSITTRAYRLACSRASVTRCERACEAAHGATPRAAIKQTNSRERADLLAASRYSTPSPSTRAKRRARRLRPRSARRVATHVEPLHAQDNSMTRAATRVRRRCVRLDVRENTRTLVDV